MTREELEKEYYKIKAESDMIMNTIYKPINRQRANEELRNELAFFISGVSLIISLYVIFFK